MTKEECKKFLLDEIDRIFFSGAEVKDCSIDNDIIETAYVDISDHRCVRTTTGWELSTLKIRYRRRP